MPGDGLASLKNHQPQQTNTMSDTRNHIIHYAKPVNERGQTKLQRIVDIYRPMYRHGSPPIMSELEQDELADMWTTLDPSENIEREALLGLFAVIVGPMLGDLEPEHWENIPPRADLESKIAQLKADGFEQRGNRLFPLDRYRLAADAVDASLVRVLVGRGLDMGDGACADDNFLAPSGEVAGGGQGDADECVAHGAVDAADPAKTTQGERIEA